MKYTHILKDLIDNFYITTYPKDFTLESNTFGYDKVIEGDAQVVCGRGRVLKDEWLNLDFYKFGPNHIQTDKTFHRKDVVDFLKGYKRLNTGSFQNAMKSNKKVIMEMEMHGVSEHPNSYSLFRINFFDKLFRNKEVLRKMQEGKFFIFLYFGWEADDFRKDEKPADKYRNWYEMFRSVLIDYKLPTNSVIIAQSNLLGYENEKKYDFKGVKPNVIFDNVTEFQPFKSVARNDKLNIDYPIEEHFKNLRKSKHTLLRIHRTWHPYRDNMLYYLYKNNYINESLVQHRVFEKEGIPEAHNFFDYRGRVEDLSEKSKDVVLTHHNIIKQISKDIPIKSSEYEKSLVIGSNDHIVYNKGEHHISNEPIDNSVYEDSLFSWVNPSLPDKKNYIFINQSTFSPILHYHPILWFGHTHLIKHFKKYGYKSFDWLFDESYDELTSDLDKFKANAKQIDKVMNMDKDYLIDLMWDNRDTLQHNRDLFIECKSIERIITKLHGIINETTI